MNSSKVVFNFPGQPEKIFTTPNDDQFDLLVNSFTRFLKKFIMTGNDIDENMANQYLSVKDNLTDITNGSGLKKSIIFDIIVL